MVALVTVKKSAMGLKEAMGASKRATKFKVGSKVVPPEGTSGEETATVNAVR